MVEHFGIQQAEGFSHLMEGWVIFIACVLLLFGLAWMLLRFQSNPTSLVDALDLDTTGLGEQALRIKALQPSSALIAMTALYLVAATAWSLAPERAQAAIEREPLTLFPARFEDWRGLPPTVLTPELIGMLGADDYRSVVYRRAPGESIELFMAWYEDQSMGGIHSPEICIPGGGWEFATLERVDVAAEVELDDPMPVNRAVIQKGVDRVMLYYWFEQYGGRSAWDFAAKVKLIWYGLRHGRTDGALMRLATPIQPGESDAAAEARLQSLLRPVVDALPRFVPRI
jgi:exosortase D (VPLPA-CTERM-specific)